MATGDDKQSKTSLNEVMSAIDEIGERICKDLEPKILLWSEVGHYYGQRDTTARLIKRKYTQWAFHSGCRAGL